MTSEQEWEQVLQIKTTGRDDSRSDAEHHPMSQRSIVFLNALPIVVILRNKIPSSIMVVARGGSAYLWLIRRGAILSVSNTMNVCMNVPS